MTLAVEQREVQRTMKTDADQFAEPLPTVGVKPIYGISGAEDRARFRRSKADGV
jgi:hypothetical protein